MHDNDRQVVTHAVFAALQNSRDPRAWADLLFLQDFQQGRTNDLGATLRASQIRRANPGLAAAIERELKEPA